MRFTTKRLVAASRIKAELAFIPYSARCYMIDRVSLNRIRLFHGGLCLLQKYSGGTAKIISYYLKFISYFRISG